MPTGQNISEYGGDSQGPSPDNVVPPYGKSRHAPQSTLRPKKVYNIFNRPGTLQAIDEQDPGVGGEYDIRPAKGSGKGRHVQMENREREDNRPNFGSAL